MLAYLRPSGLFNADDGPLLTGLPSQVTGNIRVFPNPSKGSFRVVTPHAANFQFVLYDMMGRPVMTGNGSSGNMLTMDVPSGIYLLRVQTPDGVFAHRIIRE